MTGGPGRRGDEDGARERIEHAALELFRREGFEAVTVGDLCRAAGVSPATFYRRFASKEDVVFSYRERFSAALREAVATVPDGSARRDQLPRILTAFADFLENQREMLVLQRELVEGHPALLRRTLAVQNDLEVQLASSLAELNGLSQPDDACRLGAAVGLTVVRAAVCSRPSGAGPSFGVATRRALDDLGGLLRPSGGDRGGRASPDDERRG
ncbi:TetR/AcrR family transcriptional regulator [Modestobacter marinus]|uniref:TetR/AcrR family transcriptional regulator n=1 Tax=Modestobacter marinus TaxID=477641 RepID=UPI001C95F550|nr:TetR/AcrR family transcriptional regulator [Modestobacter marinus]